MKGKKMLLNGNGKKKLGKGIGRLYIFLLAISMVVSCNNVMEPPTASGVGDGRAYLKISASETARTVVPQLDFQNLSFALTGSLAGGNSQSLGSWNTYSAMSSALISLEIGEWSFTFTARNASGVVLEKSIAKNITSGTHVLDFGTLAFSSGSGSVSVTLILPLNHGVATASAALYEVSSNNLVTGTEQSLFLEDSQADGRQAVTYTQSNVTGGNYFLKFEFTQALQSDVTDVYQELVQVAPHLTSSATRELVALNSYYQVTLNTDGGTFSPDTTPSSFSRYDEVQLPTPTKEGYIFGGWYDEGDFTKTPVKTLPKGTDRDHNLTARWVQEVFVSAGGNDSNFGVSSSPFKSLQAAVNAIDAANDGTSSYTIKVMDNVDDSSSSSYDTSNNSALINIAPTKALNITIKSSDDNTQRTINAGRDASKTGRVMYVGTYATVTIQNLVLTGGNIAESGGGVFVGGGNFIINGGAIANNVSSNDNGGGVYVDGNSTFTANSGTIGGNGAGNSAKNGGAIYIAASGKVELKGATISYNVSDTSGGGVANYGTFEMTSGSVTNNTSGHNGGGVNNSGTLTMTGGTIANNTATADGVGVYDSGTLSLGGSAVIEGELYWVSTAEAITITSSLSPSSGTTATIRPSSYTTGISILTAGSGFTGLANEVEKFEVVQKDNISIWSIDDTGKLKIDSIATTFPVVNDSYVYSSVNDARSWISTNGVLGLSDAITQDQVIDVLDAIYSARVSNITLDLSRVANLQSFTPDINQFSQYLGNGSCPISVIIFPESVYSIDWSVFHYAQSLTAYFMDVESTWTISNGGSFSAAENGGKASYSHIVSGGTWTKN